VSEIPLQLDVGDPLAQRLGVEGHDALTSKGTGGERHNVTDAQL
jgi:hypothetical protein